MDALLCFIRGEWGKRTGFPSGAKPTLILTLSTSGDLFGRIYGCCNSGLYDDYENDVKVA